VLSLSTYDDNEYTGFIRYPAFGSPEIMKKDETLALYIEEGDPDAYASEWKIKIRHRVTSEIYELVNLETETSTLTSCGKITAEIPSSAELGMYDIILEHGEDSLWVHDDTAIHSLQLIESYRSDPKFAQISDVHVGKLGAERDLAKMVSELNARDDLDFVILTGDIAHGGIPLGDIKHSVGEVRDTAYLEVENEWKVIWYVLQHLDVPIYMTPGNHDYYQYPSVAWIDEDLDRFHKYLLPEFKIKTPIQQVKEGDPADYSFTYGDYHFISVNSGKPLNYGLSTELAGFSKEQLDWIKRDYEDAGSRHTFIFTHAPIVSVHKGEFMGYPLYGMEDFTHESPNDYHFVEWIEDHDPNIEVVLCGHTHQRHYYNETKIDEDRLDRDEHGNPIPSDKGIDWCELFYDHHFSYPFSDTMLVTELG